MPYNDPVRLFLKGDRVEAAKHVREARTMLWRLARTTANSGAASARDHQKLAGGVTVDLVIAGLQAAIVITAPGGEAGTIKIEDTFVVYPRTEALPDGIHAETPQLMLRYESDVDQWFTLFHTAEVPGYDDLARPKGTYRTEKGELAFPDGVKHAGNIDWRGNDGLRLSWYGPSSRYFFDPYVEPTTQYGKHVFMLGQVLLDVDQYITESLPLAEFDERYVMGAALSPDRKRLFVVMANLPAGTTDTGTVPPFTVSVPSPWPQETFSVQLCEFRVSNNPALKQVMRMSVVPGSRVVLHTQMLTNAYNPWFFNASATRAVSVGLPASVTTVTDYQQGGLVAAPSEFSQVFTASVGFGGFIATTQVGIGLAPFTAMLAVDFREDTLVELQVRRTGVADAPESFSLMLDGREYRLYSRLNLGSPFSQSVFHRYIYHADIREKTLVLHNLAVAYDFSTETIISSSASLDLYQDGALKKSLPIPFFDAIAGGLGSQIVALDNDWRDATTGVHLSPHYALYGIGGGYEPPGTTFIRWHGAIAGYRYLAYPGSEYFGAYGVTANTPKIYDPISADANGGFDGDRLDIHGKYSVLGCASYDGATMLSGYGFRAGTGLSSHLVVSPEVGATLPVLTGVSGAKERYQPIWLLGALPRQDS